jgi:hypothetical protein
MACRTSGIARRSARGVLLVAETVAVTTDLLVRGARSDSRLLIEIGADGR